MRRIKNVETYKFCGLQKCTMPMFYSGDHTVYSVQDIPPIQYLIHESMLQYTAEN